MPSLNDRETARRLLYRHLRMMVEGKRDGRLVAVRGEVQAELEEFGGEVERRMGNDARERFMALYTEERAAERAMIRERESAEAVATQPQPPQGKGAVVTFWAWFVFGAVFTAVVLLGRR